MFPPDLEVAGGAAPVGSVFVIDRYRGTGAIRGACWAGIKKRAGLVRWPKRMQNLRASRETELMAKLPAKDVSG